MAFFNEIAKKYGLLPALGRQILATGKAKAQELRIKEKFEEAVKPKAISTTKTTPKFSFFGDIAQKYNLKVPEFVKPRQEPESPLKITPEIQEKSRKIKDALKNFARAFPREGAGAALEIIERLPGHGEVSIQPGTGEIFPREKYGELGPKAEKIIFGEKPVESLSKQGEEFLRGFGISEPSAQEFGLTIGVMLLGLDLLPPQAKNTLRLLVEANKADNVKKILAGIKGIDMAKVTDDVADKIARTTDARLINEMVNKLRGIPARVTREAVTLARKEEQFLESLYKDILRELEKPKGQQRSAIAFIKKLGEFPQTVYQEIKQELGISKSVREMNLEELGDFVGKMKGRLRFKHERGFQPSALKQISKVETAIPTVAENSQIIKSVKEFQNMKVGAVIPNPNVVFSIGKITDDVAGKLGIGTETEISRRVIKHIVERRGDAAEELIRSIPAIIANPSKVSRSKFPGRLQFTRMDGKGRATVIEVIKKPDGKNQVVTAFFVPRRTFDKLVDISGRPTVPPSTLREVAEQQSKISDFQKPTSESIGQVEKKVKLEFDVQGEAGISRAGLLDKAREFGEEFYQQNFEIAKAAKVGFEEKISRFGEELGRGAEVLLAPISTRLKLIAPWLKARLRLYEFNVRNVVMRDKSMVDPFLSGLQKAQATDFDIVSLDLALKNGDSSTITAIIRKYDLEKEYNAARQALDNLYTRAREVGYDVGYLEDYWPREIKDARGFLQYLEGKEYWSFIDEAIKRREMQLGRYLTEEERAGLANTLLRGYRTSQITLSTPGALKARGIDIVDPELNRFYRSSFETLPNYIEKVNDAIEARKFFGKHLKGLPEGIYNVEDSIGAYTANLLAEGKITPIQELELRSILQARFGMRGGGGILGAYRNLAYIDTLGNIENAITQLGDMAFAMYKGGPIRALGEGLNSVLGKSRITKEDIGFATRDIAAELSSKSKLARALDWILGVTGFNKIDRMGAESLVNAAVRRAQQEAIKPSQKFLKELEAVFPKQLFGGGIIDDVLREFRSGEITDNVKFYAFNTLLDFSPRALSEMPEMYLKSGNGRIFYMLKTWTLKMLDAFRNEAFHTMKEDKVDGLKNLFRLGGFLFLMNATADTIKDFISGREIKADDIAVDNIAKLVGFSRYTVTQIQKEGLGSALTEQLQPPLPTLDNISKDIADLYKDFDESANINKLRTVGEIPIGGRLYYFWFGRGAERRKEKELIEIPTIELELPEISIPTISL